jgi:thiol:disulfide interchange protein DsbD
MRNSGIVLLLLSRLVCCGIAAENPLGIELVSQATGIQPGKPFHVGLHLQHPAGYHTYWKFAGVVGVPTGIAWNLPDGWKAGEIEWPEPERVFMFQIKAQGFHGEKLLPIQITPPGNLQPGGVVKIEGRVIWMCCGRECRPGFKNVSIELPVTGAPTPPDRRWHTMFADSLASVARTSGDWLTEAERSGGEIVLRVRPASARARSHFHRIKDVTFFTEDGLVDPNKPESVTKTATEIVVTQTISEYGPKRWPRRMAGILQTPQGWHPDGNPKSIRISAPLAR